MEGFREFEFDLPEALLRKLVLAFDSMASAPLLPENVSPLPEVQGLYQLLYRNHIVYIGKTDADSGLRQRLTRHAWTIQHRGNLEASEVMFRALRVFVFTAIDLETQLIRHYGGLASVAWNKSGFGSNDPGRERDTTKLKPGGFDQLYPIDLNRPLDLHHVQGNTVASLLDGLRDLVPYTIRSEREQGSRLNGHRDLLVQAPAISGTTTAREVLKMIVSSLPSGWQATLLPGRVILYKETRDYPSGLVIAHS